MRIIEIKKVVNKTIIKIIAINNHPSKFPILNSFSGTSGGIGLQVF
jgi:hypothetical protein